MHCYNSFLKYYELGGRFFFYAVRFLCIPVRPMTSIYWQGWLPCSGLISTWSLDSYNWKPQAKQECHHL